MMLEVARLGLVDEARAASWHALKRLATPDEIAAPIVFLLSDDASFITGSGLLVDGGFSALKAEAQNSQ
jgi:NAD(P)-dependent dehydrogenase (short-subunit alcohol dehydrogenase family)